jgi:hypothetical protein
VQENDAHDWESNLSRAVAGSVSGPEVAASSS